MIDTMMAKAELLRQKHCISRQQVADRAGLSLEIVDEIIAGDRIDWEDSARIQKAISELAVPLIKKRTDEKLKALNLKNNANDEKETETMAKEKEYGLTDEQVEQEIERLRQSPLVALARREQRLRYKRRQFLYQLRDLEKKGAALMKAGITMDVLNAMAELGDCDDV